MTQPTAPAFDAAEANYGVPEDPARLTALACAEVLADVSPIASALASDRVVLVRDSTPEQAEAIILKVAQHFGLKSQLEAQATFAAIKGHRQNAGQYYMTVNKRDDYQFISSHSEGDSRAAIQLASFYCHENTTDGGVTIVQNTKDESLAWQSLREVRLKVDTGGKALSTSESTRARIALGVNLPQDLLATGDVPLKEHSSPFPNLKLFDVLCKVGKTKSLILNRDVNVYWDTIEGYDRDAVTSYARLLRSCGLLKAPEGYDLQRLDNTRARRSWSSGVAYEQLFKARITHKLLAGELLIQNNLTWTHSCSNWTPGSGKRNVVAAFA